jgi:alkanesulfonate monooxygenase SsuD/methylene tetrahydromethanopterin reductase-like flavin-dependent oxidoreductase (luciferase family)
MRLGVVIMPEDRWAINREWWERAEQLKFDHAWTYDHLTWRDLRDGPWFSAVPWLAAAAMCTTTLRLGTLVASPNFRHPVTFAKELMTLDDISNGRLTLGIGAGGSGFDSFALGQDSWSRKERTDRFEEFISMLDHLMTHEATEELVGEFYSAKEARNIPGSVQKPRIPFAIAATGARGISIAVEYGAMWVTNGFSSNPLEATSQEHQSAVRNQIALLEEECDRKGRDFASIPKLFLASSRNEPWFDSVSSFTELREIYREIGITDLVIHRPRKSHPFKGDEKLFEDIALLPREF